MSVITQATAGQIKQINRFGFDAIEKVLEELGLDNPSAQRVIMHGDEFVAAIREAALASLRDLSASDKFKNEERSSSYGYLSGYKPKNITEQTNRLRELFPGIGYADETIAEGALPSHAEGWFAIPKWQTIASTYGEAVQKVLDAIKATRNGKFHNYREGQLGPERLRQSTASAAAFQKLGDEQKDHDIMVVPAQFGIRHRGRSVRRAREVFILNIMVVPAQFGIRHRGRSVRRAREVFILTEFGLGAFANGIMILTHPERLMHYDDLWIDCAGDDFDDADSDVRFDHAPIFRFYNGEAEFDTSSQSNAYGYYGSASGFVPQC